MKRKGRYAELSYPYNPSPSGSEGEDFEVSDGELDKFEMVLNDPKNDGMDSESLEFVGDGT